MGPTEASVSSITVSRSSGAVASRRRPWAQPPASRMAVHGGVEPGLIRAAAQHGAVALGGEAFPRGGANAGAGAQDQNHGRLCGRVHGVLP
jgi:hypothetical protein